MFGFHQRTRSLIPIASMEKSEKAAHVDPNNNTTTLDHDVEPDDDEPLQTPRQKRNLTMILLLFLAEALMSASLSSQIAVLVPSDTHCLSMDTSFLRSILQGAYYLGSTAGLFWGPAADKYGRRRIALVGLGGMVACCVSMGFAQSFTAFALLRFVAGVVGAGTSMAGLAMLADVTYGSTKTRVKVVSRLPMVAVCGSIGPLVAHMWHEAFDGSRFPVFAMFPGLSGQIACAGLVVTVAGMEAVLLEETLPSMAVRQRRHDEETPGDSEKAAFLGQTFADDDEEDSLNITIIEALHAPPASNHPSTLTLPILLTTPSLLTLLTSFALLTLHSTLFDILLPHIGHTPTHTGGLGLPCAWLPPLTTVVAVLAALRVARLVPWVVGKVGLLTMYRKTSLFFPLLYALVPLAVLGVHVSGGNAAIAAPVGTAVLYFKTALAGAAKVLVLLLVLSAAPDAYSTGTVLGVVSISELFRALAVAVSGIGYYLSDDHALVVINGALWATLVVTGLIGAAVTLKLRETPRVGADIPEECLVWEGMFDSESDDGRGL